MPRLSLAYTTGVVTPRNFSNGNIGNGSRTSLVVAEEKRFGMRRSSTVPVEEFGRDRQRMKGLDEARVENKEAGKGEDDKMQMTEAGKVRYEDIMRNVIKEPPVVVKKREVESGAGSSPVLGWMAGFGSSKRKSLKVGK